MGSSTTTTNKYDTRVTDAFSQYGMGTGDRQRVGNQVMDASMAGLGNLQDLAAGRWGSGGGGGGGGGGSAGFGGGIMGLGKEALALKNDPLDDDYINRALGRGVEGIHGEGRIQEDLARQAAARSGTDTSSPAYMRTFGNIGKEASGQASQFREGFSQKLAEEKLQNLRMLAEQETNLRGISRSAMGTENAARTGAAASNYASNNARSGQMDSLRAQAAGMLGTGEAWRGFSQPFDVAHLNTETKTRENPGIGGLIGTGLGVASMFTPAGSFGSMMGGKGGGNPFNNPATAGTGARLMR